MTKMQDKTAKALGKTQVAKESGRDNQQRITQHKRFAIAHPNFCFAKTSQTPKPLYAIGRMRRCEDETLP